MHITSNTRYLKIPVNNTSASSKIRIFGDEQLLIDLDTCFDKSAHSVMYYDLAPFMGRDITVTHDSGHAFEFCANIPDAPAEAFRPKVHFTAPYGWINDPNGLVYYRGVYHLFYQHNPAGTKWGNMHWGHALSRDLVHFEHLNEALFPDELGDMFSGSAMVDEENLLGLNTPEHKAILLFYTAAGGHREINREAKFTQCLAYSLDGGHTFQKYAKNPIVPHIKAQNRDPKVVYDEENDVYLMALYLDGAEYALLTSNDLISWQQLQTFELPGDDECPDIYKMDNGKGERKWVICGAHDRYTVCDFDPSAGFVNMTEPRTLGFGSVYAAQSYSGTARRIRYSWNRFTAVPSKYFNCELSVPCELRLFGNELRIAPARELERAYIFSETIENLPSHGISMEVGRSFDITLELSRLEEAVIIMLCGNEIKLDPMSGVVTVNSECTMPLCPTNDKARVRLIADNYGIELFTGIEDGYAKAFGAFPCEITGDMLIMRGEGSLDKLVINKF
ncbi:MAG: glycoside hydrolase family 32 protein [Clostridia bacterium]|nr:glycoside hydrolase family 32 protein [Clostridia bacterium]